MSMLMDRLLEERVNNKDVAGIKACIEYGAEMTEEARKILKEGENERNKV